jgi:hypothetical protein
LESETLTEVSTADEISKTHTPKGTAEFCIRGGVSGSITVCQLSAGREWISKPGAEDSDGKELFFFSPQPPTSRRMDGGL